MNVKSLCLLILTSLSLIYALPNFYGEDLAVQVSSHTHKVWGNTEQQHIQKILENKKLTPIGVSAMPNGMLFRFSNISLQMQAKEVIKKALGHDYSVALNLAPKTPGWLSALGAKPMKLGLDLRGGVHFLLNVDVDAVIKARKLGDMRTFGSVLRERKIRYTHIGWFPKSNRIQIVFRDQSNQVKGKALLAHRFGDYVFDVLPSKRIISAKISEPVLTKIQDYVIDQTRTILINRVNELGVSEAIVQRQGLHHISVDLPGIQDTARAKAMLGKTATLRFQLVDTEHDIASVLNGNIPFGSKLYYYADSDHDQSKIKRPVLLKNNVILKGSAVTYATALYRDGRPAVNIHLGGGGERLFHKETLANIGKALAVLYIETKPEKKRIDGQLVTLHRQYPQVISVATIQSALGSNFDITGLSSMEYAQNLALLLRSGALSAPVDIVQELTVGPSLGKANIHKGILSLIVGSLLVIIFMLVYYRVFGFIANLALFLNVIFIIAILSLLGATLTLPGIAGIVLTVGMAVDANVLINERIREELRLGMSPLTSIKAGYEKAFSTIIDANVTTLIVAAVLFGLGSGSVKGFAVTLMIGLLASMITAIFFTRMMVEWVYHRPNCLNKRLSIGIEY